MISWKMKSLVLSLFFIPLFIVGLSQVFEQLKGSRVPHTQLGRISSINIVHS